MAGILTIKNTSAAYNRKEGRILVKRTYYYKGSDPEDIVGVEYGNLAADKVPETVDVDDPNGDTVTCYAIDREALRPENSGESETWLTVNYEGFSLGPMYYELDCVMNSELTLFGLPDPITGQSEAIGVNGEGTNVERVSVVMKIRQNVTIAAFVPNGISLMLALSGAVNEDGWKPDILDLGHIAFYEGQWRYDGADHTFYPGGYCTLDHTFVMQEGIAPPLRPEDLSVYKWRPVATFSEKQDVPDGAGGTKSVDREVKVYGEETSAKIRRIAGTDMAQTFADLAL